MLKPFKPFHQHFLPRSTITLDSNKLYSSGGAFLRLDNLFVQSIDIFKNDIYKNHGNQVTLTNVRAFNHEIKRVSIRENIVQEALQGHGICVERSSCHLEANEIIKCDHHGIVVSSKVG
jgi:hypothetical protein